jgi:exopolysaccharide biosynthesis polyprenyl glycosylphosphotransferase
MLKNRNEQIQLVIRTLDIAICIVSFFIAYTVRSTLLTKYYGPISSAGSLEWILDASVALHLLTYSSFRFYHSLRLRTVYDITTGVLSAAVVEFFVLGALVFLLQAKDTSRYFFGLFLAINYSLILAEKIGARLLLSSIRKRGYNHRQILIVGTGQNASRVIAAFVRNRHWGYVPCGVLQNTSDASAVEVVDGVPVIGKLDQLEALVRTKTVDEVYFALDTIDVQEISQEIRLCEKLGIPARFSLSFFPFEKSDLTLHVVDHLPILSYYTTVMTPFEAAVKRLFDVLISAGGIAITLVLLPWISYQIRKESPGPIFFKQIRVGENGRRFKCYKFRTMSLDAETRKKDLEAQNLMAGPMFKMENDPRVFPFGRFLRKTSLDELPQFLNILRGEMSVVGTRPPTPGEVEQYESHFRRRLSIRPGLTGMWQVSGRNQITQFEEVVKMDLHYIDNWSIWLDLQIIMRTIWITLFRRGAF